MSCITRTALPMVREADQLCIENRLMGARSLYVMTAPVMFVSSIADMGIGLASGIVSLVSLGMQRDVVQYTEFQLGFAGACMLASPYLCFLKALFPAAEWHPRDRLYLLLRPIQLGAAAAVECLQSDHVIIRHGASRLFYFLVMIGLIFERTTQLIMCVVTVPLSLLCLGRWRMMNATAYSGLQAPLIIHDIFILTIKMLNPWAGPFPDYLLLY